MYIDVCNKTNSINPLPLEFEVSYRVEPEDPRDTLVSMLYGLMTFSIAKDGSFKTSVMDFLIFKNLITNSPVKKFIGFSSKALDVFVSLHEYLDRLVSIKNGEFNNEVVVNLKSKLFEDQKSAVRLFLELEKSLNCSSVGIGKTLTALATFNHLEQQKKCSKCLVFTLNQIKNEWSREIRKHTNYSYRLIGNGTDVVLSDIEKFDEQILVFHYDALLNDLVQAALANMLFDFWVIDEAHTLRNINSQRTTILHNLYNSLKPRYINMLTGTPVSNSPMNAYSILRLVKPSLVPSKAKFDQHFCNFILIKPKNAKGRKIPILNKKNPYKKLPELQLLMNTIAYRKTHDEVKDFPETLVTIKDIEMDNEQQALYNRIKNETYLEIAKMPEKVMNLNMAIVKTLRLRQITSHPALLGEYNVKSAKFDVLDGLLEEILEDEAQKVVLFSCHRLTLDLLVHKYKDKYGASLFAGVGDGLTEEQRTKNDAEFFVNSEKRILCSITSLGVGGNWGQVARTGIMVDLPIIPIDYKQSIGRITRRGAKGCSSIIHLLCQNTVDQWVSNLLDRAKDTSGQIIKGDENITIEKDELIKGLE